MKNIYLLINLMLLCFVFAGCKSEQDLIKESAMGYLTAMGNYKISDAEPYATEETIENTLHDIEKYIMPNLEPNVISENTPATIEIKEVLFTSDTTAEVLYTKTTPKQTQDGKLDMVKRPNGWKAQVKIQIPQALKFEKQIDVKAVEEKYKGKLQAGKKGEVPPKFQENINRD